MQRVCLILSLAACVLVWSPVAAQDDEDEAEATIAALQTQVAELEQKYASLRERYNRLRDQLDSEEQALLSPTAESAGNELGQERELGQWLLVVDSTDFIAVAAPNSGIDESARGVVLVVNLTVTNAPSTPAKFPFTEFTVTDSENRSFSANENATVAHFIALFNETPRVLELQPSLPYQVPVLFDVPIDAGGFVLADTGNRITVALDR